jgi:hypothetical protein
VLFEFRLPATSSGAHCRSSNAHWRRNVVQMRRQLPSPRDVAERSPVTDVTRDPFGPSDFLLPVFRMPMSCIGTVFDTAIEATIQIGQRCKVETGDDAGEPYVVGCATRALRRLRGMWKLYGVLEFARVGDSTRVIGSPVEPDDVAMGGPRLC